MLLKTRYFFILSIIVFVCSCSKGNYRTNQNSLINSYANKNYQEVEKKVLNEDFLKGNENVLLKSLEVGNAYYNNGKYCSAIEAFNKSTSIIEEQQTKSIGKAISSNLGAGDDVFYGETYEKSLVNFYKSLINYEIFARGFCEYENKESKQLLTKTLTNQERINYLMSAKANVLYWDSWMNGRYIDDYDKLYYKDLLIKLWGAFIHEQIGDKENLQIAKQLYIDAKDIAVNRYAVYRAFNKNNISFVNNLKDEVKRKSFIDLNNLYVRDIVEYCDRQLERLKQGQSANLAIVIQDGQITNKKVVVKRVPVLSLLGLASGNIYKLILALSLDRATYELPTMSSKTPDYRYFYELRKDNNVVIRKPIVLSEPISDISYMNLYEKFEKIKSEIISSVTAKYLALLTPIAITYAISSNSNNSYVKLAGLATAVAAYKAGEYGITKSGLVDIRQWVGLPSNIFMVSDNVEHGEYELNIIKQSNLTLQEQIVYKNNVNIGETVSFFDLKL